MDATHLAIPIQIAAPAASHEACANCNAPRMGAYCYSCGQHFLDGRLTVWRLLVDVLIRKLGLEGGLLRTVVDLTVRPATMIKGYVHGRRQRYTNPVGYLLLAAGAYLLLGSLWKEVMIQGIRAQNQGIEGWDAESAVQVQMFMEAHPALMTVVICLFLVPPLRLLFLRTTTIAEATVFSLFISGHLLLMQMVINIGALLFSEQPYEVMSGVITMLPVAVFFFAAGQFFGTRFTSFLRLTIALAVALFGLVLLLAISVVVVNEWTVIMQGTATG